MMTGLLVIAGVALVGTLVIMIFLRNYDLAESINTCCCGFSIFIVIVAMIVAITVTAINYF